MKIDTFLTCLGYYGISTGTSSSIEGLYSLDSGTTGVIFNQIYASGAHFLNNKIYSATIPLINVFHPHYNNQQFSGDDGWKVGYQHTGNFGIVLEMAYSGCQRPVAQRGMVLVSTAASPSNLDSGFYVGVTENGYLYFQTSGYSSTLNRELGIHNFVYVGLSENTYVTFGIFDLDENKLYKNTIGLSTGRLVSDAIYVGNFLTNNQNAYTGFSGYLYKTMLFNNTLTDVDVGICSNCSMATGYNTATTAYSFVAQQLTGFYFSGVNESTITGYENVTQQIVTHDGSLLDVITPSGVVASVQTGQFVVPLFSGITVQGERDGYVFLYDEDTLNNFSTFSLFFNAELWSGDLVEVYTYPQPNTNIGKLFDGFMWPTGESNIQVIANGLNETLNVDYSIYRNMLSGFSTDDVLSYDVLSASPIITAFSGYWYGTSRILMSGGGFYPNSPQYFEDTSNFTGIIKITGLSGICTNNPFYPSFGYDLHMNGQKLVSGLHYNVIQSGDNGFVISLSGNSLPALIIYPTYDITGGGPIDVSEVEDSELAFIPEFSGFRQSYVYVTGNSHSFSSFTGFGEQVWVNGIRQRAELDYRKILPCSNITGQFNAPILDFVLYNSEDGNDSLWNIQVPPTVSIATGGQANIEVTISLDNLNGHNPSGNCVEAWSSQLDNSQTFGPFKLWGFIPTGYALIYYTGYRAGLNGTGVVLARYHRNNVMGNWTMTPSMTLFDNT